MFQCSLCDKNIADGCKIYIVTKGIVINEEWDNLKSLKVEDEEYIYCSPLCLATDFDP